MLRIFSSSNSTSRRALLCAALLCPAAACGDDASSDDDARSEEQGAASGNMQASGADAGGASSADAASGDPGSRDGGSGRPDGESTLFAAAATQFTPEGSTSGLWTLPDPGERSSVAIDEARELPGSAALFGAERAGYVVVGSSDGPTLTRYSLDDAGELREGPSLSFSAYGIASGFKRPGLVPILSSDKAYFLDDSSLQGIVWNPAEMTVGDAFSLADAQPDGLVLELGENAVLRDGLLFVPANYRTGDDGEAGTALVLVIDTETDELAHVIEDDRCGNTLHAVLDEDGFIYVATGTIGAAFHAIGFPADYPEPCLLRIAPGQTEFDPEFHRSLVDLAGGRPAGRLVRGKAGYYYVAVLLEEELDAPIGSTDNIYAEWEATAWRLFRFRLDEEGPATPMDELPLSGGGGRVLFAGGVEYVQQVQNDLAKTTLYVPQEDGSFSRGLEVPGVPYGLRRIR